MKQRTGSQPARATSQPRAITAAPLALAVAMASLVCLQLPLLGALSPAAKAAAAKPAEAPAAKAADGKVAAPALNEPAADAGAPSSVLSAEEPPRTAYDELGQAGRPTLAPESFALVRQLGRTLLALLFTCALIYLLFRLGLPRLVGLWSNTGPQTLSIRERVPLDGSNQVVRLEAETGESYLLGVGSGGIKLLDKWSAPAGEPLPGPRRPRSQFAEALRGVPTDPQGSGETPP